MFNGKRELIPPPTHCPGCRQQRRLAFRNERNLHHRKCDSTRKQVISSYSPDNPVTVYNQDIWWSDTWNPQDYGKEYDFHRPFFEQFNELIQTVPRINLINKEHENSEYCNFATSNKDCYLLFTAGWNRDSLYSNRILHSNTVCDCSNVTECELCYEVIDSVQCYHCTWLQNCKNCSNCTIGYDLQGCKDCFACFGLRNKQYCIGNTQYTKEDYEKEKQELSKNIRVVWENYRSHLQASPRKFADILNCANTTGDALSDCTNCHACFEAKQLQDCAYICNATKLKDCYDINNDDHSELDYEVCGGDSNYNQCFTDISWFNKHIYYCSLCFHSSNLFGCIGMKLNQYCILNTQYSKEEYEILVPKIIEHMRATGEWGEFFPMTMSPYTYNETVAMDYAPLGKEEIQEQGLFWSDQSNESEHYMGPSTYAPDTIDELDDDICTTVLTCRKTGKQYKIIKQELDFYRKQHITPPDTCPDQRHRQRLEQRSKRELHKRICTKCQKALMSPYDSSRSEVILCEECYLKEVY